METSREPSAGAVGGALDSSGSSGPRAPRYPSGSNDSNDPDGSNDSNGARNRNGPRNSPGTGGSGSGDSHKPNGRSPTDAGSAGRGLALLLAAGVLWGTGGIAGQVLQQRFGMSALTVACCRLLIAGTLISLALVVFDRRRRTGDAEPMSAEQMGAEPTDGPPPRRWSRGVLPRLGANAVLHALFQALYFGSLALIPVGLATLVKIGSVPVFVAVGLCLVSRRRPSGRLTLTVVSAVAGLGLLAGFPATDVSGPRLVAGLACALGAGLTFSVMTVLNRKPVAGLNPVANTGLGLLLGGILLAPVGLAAGPTLPVQPEALALLAFLGIVPTTLAYLAYFGGLPYASDVGAAVGTLAEPLTAALLSMLLLDERITAVGAIGIVLLVGSMLTDYVNRPRRRRPPGQETTDESSDGSVAGW